MLSHVSAKKLILRDSKENGERFSELVTTTFLNLFFIYARALGSLRWGLIVEFRCKVSCVTLLYLRFAFSEFWSAVFFRFFSFGGWLSEGERFLIGAVAGRMWLYRLLRHGVLVWVSCSMCFLCCVCVGFVLRACMYFCRCCSSECFFAPQCWVF